MTDNEKELMPKKLSYRTKEFDDWGVVRDSETGKMFCLLRVLGGIEEQDKHRADKTDPCEPMAVELIKRWNSRPQPSADVGIAITYLDTITNRRLLEDTANNPYRRLAYMSELHHIRQALTQPKGDDFKQLTFGRGMLDINNITFEGRDGLLFKKRINYSPVGTEDKEKLGETEFYKDDIVFWFDTKEGAENLINEIALCANINKPKAVDVEGLIRVQKTIKKCAKIAHRYRDINTSVDLNIAWENITYIIDQSSEQGLLNTNERVKELANTLTDTRTVCNHWRKLAHERETQLKMATDALNKIERTSNDDLAKNQSRKALQQMEGGRDE